MKKQKLIKAIVAVHETNPTAYRALDQIYDWLIDQENHIKSIERDMKRFAKLFAQHGGE